MQLAEVLQMAERLMVADQLDFLDMSLWDVWKEPEEEAFHGRPLIDYFTALPRGRTLLGVAGKIRTPAEAERALAAGVDWIMLGRAAILHHDFPARYAQNPRFTPAELPVSRDYLAAEGLSPVFVDYMAGWPGFVAD